MKTLPLLLVLAVFAGRSAAQEKIKLADLTLEDGTVLKDTMVLKVEPDGLRLEHHDGVSKVKFENLPQEVQKRFTFDRDQAEKFREEKEIARATKAAAERKARVEELLRQRREVQDLDVARGREDFYRILEAGEYSYPQLDKALQQSIADLKEVGRKDLAAVLESDRKLLRERELTRPGEKARQEKEQLTARIRDLENQVNLLNNQPQPVEVVQDVAMIPIFVDRPIVVDRPYVVDRSVIVPRPGVTPGPCAVPSGYPAAGVPRTVSPSTPFVPPAHVSPAMPSHPSAPAIPSAPYVPHSSPPVAPAVPSAPYVPHSSLPVAPSHSVTPTRVSMPSGGAQQHGAHLWKR